MTEQIPQTPRSEQEQKPEFIPISAEVKVVFEQLTGGETYTKNQKLEDEKGLFLWK